MLLRERYELGEPIAEGTFDITLQATDRHSDETVAVKRVCLSDLGDWASLEALEREARLLRGLDHPGVPSFIEAFEGEHEGKPAFYFVAKHVEGETLAERIARGARWTNQQAHDLVTAVLEILTALHELSPRVIHRDIKPDNVVIRSDGSVVLVGFGAVQDPSGASPTIVGTPGYMPPEQAVGVADPRSDLYALAATMVHAVTHRPPAEVVAEGARSQVGVGARVRALAGIDENLSRVLERMLEPVPDQRFSSARAVLAALADPHGAEPAPPRPSLVLHEASEQALAIAAAPRPLTRAVRARLDFVRALQTMNRRSLVTLCSVAGAFAIIGAMARVMWVVPLALGFIMVSFFTWPLRARNSARRLYASGDVARGEVFETRENGAFSTVAYRYEVGDNAYRGELATSETATPHAVVVVFHDRDDPRHHTALLERELRALT
jgi:hypothetical protein